MTDSNDVIFNIRGLSEMDNYELNKKFMDDLMKLPRVKDFIKKHYLIYRVPGTTTYELRFYAEKGMDNIISKLTIRSQDGNMVIIDKEEEL